MGRCPPHSVELPLYVDFPADSTYKTARFDHRSSEKLGV
jgi:hypothetical protein